MICPLEVSLGPRATLPTGHPSGLQWPYHNHRQPRVWARQDDLGFEDFEDLLPVIAGIIGLTASILVSDTLRVKLEDIRARVMAKTEIQNNLLLRVFPVCEAVRDVGREAPVQTTTPSMLDNTNKINAIISHFNDITACNQPSESRVERYQGPYRYQYAQAQSRQVTAADFQIVSMVAAAAVGVGTALLVLNVMTQKFDELSTVVDDQRRALDTLAGSFQNTNAVCDAVLRAGMVGDVPTATSVDNALKINELLAIFDDVTMSP
eukprot:snap_masked-scaffold291_size219542-processed-gene-1.8 protein:Tk04633 transcript:snap_masked-scaffold291_size219542-processed-gene-1.8-mRNA-1 annotation:"conserved hypothetical protein"